MNKVRITHHALDRASQRLLHRWKEERYPGEGLYSWLYRLANKVGQDVKADTVLWYRGIRFAFRKRGKKVILATVY